MLVSMVIWGISWSSAKVLSQYGSALSIAYIRFWLVVFALFPTLKLMKIDLNVSRKGIPYVLGAGFFLGFYSLMFFTGLQHGFAGAGGVLVTTLNPILAFLVGLLISRKAPQKIEYIGLALGVVAGSALLKVWDSFEVIFSTGNLYFVVAAFLWAVMSKISSKSTDFGHPLTFSFWLHVLVSVGMSFMVDFQEVGSILQNGDRLFWMNILYFGIINSTFATCTYLFATTQIGAEKASTYIFLVPAGAMLSSWFFLDETIEWYTLLGGFLGIMAVFVINGKFSRRAAVRRA